MKTQIKLQPEEARPHFRKLILANPNYFGNVKDSPFPKVLDIQFDTTYEEIGCVGFNPQLNFLEAVVYIKQSSGYGGDICSQGTPEYVRFFLSSDNGVTWQDQGMVSFTSYDVPGDKPLEFDVTLQIDPSKIFCFVENLPKVRAILSWNNPIPPNDPNFPPVWGNVVEAHIQIAPGYLYVLADVLKQAEVELPDKFKSVIDLNQQVTAAQPEALTPAEILAHYKEAKVPGHRALFSEVHRLAANPSLTQEVMTPGFKGVLSELNVNLSEIIGQILATDGDTSFEQLNCIGLDTNRDALVGVLTVKRPNGYLGNLCTAGSQEYVAFWIDWGDGVGWTYAGTASVNVHDIKSLPPDGLKYAVFLPVDAASHRQVCQEGPKKARVRAILSWEVPPPPGNPDYKPTWGNRLETLIFIRPGEACGLGAPNIAILGGIGLADIDVFGSGMTKSGAKFALTGNDADPWVPTRSCPFGGLVTIQGCPSVGFKYRVWVRKFGSINEIMLTDPIRTVDFNGIGTWRFPDVNGFFSYLNSLDNIDNLLAWWTTSGDDLWEIRLETANMFDMLVASTVWYRIQLDNTAPTADIHIDSGGDCKDFTVDTIIAGHFVARDLHFGYFSLSTSPNTVQFPSNNPTTLTPATSQTAPAPGDPWTLNTQKPATMKPCGYVIRVDVWDRSIIGSSPFGHNYNFATVGFCLREEA